MNTPSLPSLPAVAVAVLPRAGRRRGGAAACAAVLLCWSLLAGTGPGRVRAGTLDDLQRDNGLPNAQLGTDVKSFQGLQNVEDTGRWQTYQRPGDKLVYGQFPVTEIKYNFFKGKLYSVYIDLNGRRETKGVLKMLEQRYGKPTSLDTRHIEKPKAVLKTLEWASPKVYLLYKYADDYIGGEIIYLDRPTWELLKKPRDEHVVEMRKLLQGSFVGGDF